MTSRRRALALVTLVGACAPAAAPSLAPPPASSSAPEPSAPASSSSAPAASSSAPPRATTIPGADPARVKELARLARAVVDVFDNVNPQPVERGFTKETWVQWRTDKRTPGELRWVEASTMDLHHPPKPADPVTPCAKPLAPGGVVEGGPTMRAKLVRDAMEDKLLVSSWRKKDRVASLPRGRSHGACLGPDGTRVWIAWSTPESPAEVFSVGLDSGEARALRKDARPALATLGAMKVTVGADHVVLSGGPGRKLVQVVTDGPAMGWDRLSRFLVEAGVDVRRGVKVEGVPVISFAGLGGPWVVEVEGARVVWGVGDEAGEVVVPVGEDVRARRGEAWGQLAERVAR